MCHTRAGESGSWFGIAPNEARALATAFDTCLRAAFGSSRISQRDSTPASFIDGWSTPVLIVRLTARIRCAERRRLKFIKTGNLRAVPLLLGHTKSESTVRYLGIEVDDALTISEQVEL
jgi:hypothetical protein